MLYRILVAAGFCLSSSPLNAASGQQGDATSKTVEAVSTGLNVPLTAADCGKALAYAQQSADRVKAWQSASPILDKLSLALKAASIADDLRTGKNISATQKSVTLGLEQLCHLGGEATCAAYGAGKGVGEYLSFIIPKFWGSDQTLNDMWTDTLAGWVYGSGEPTEAQLQSMIANYHAKLQQLQAANKPAPEMCADAEKRKSAIDDILAKAKDRSRGQTSVYSDPELVSETSSAATSAATARGAVLSSEFQGMANSAQSATADLQAQARTQAPPMATTADANIGMWDSKHCFQWSGTGWQSPDGSAYGRPECTGQPPPAPPKPPCIAIGGGYCAVQ